MAFRRQTLGTSLGRCLQSRFASLILFGRIPKPSNGQSQLGKPSMEVELLGWCARYASGAPATQ